MKYFFIFICTFLILFIPTSLSAVSEVDSTTNSTFATIEPTTEFVEETMQTFIDTEVEDDNFTETTIEATTEETTATAEATEENQNLTYTAEDVDVLSRLIFGEAGGHSWDLKIGVGSVVLNRVKDSRYPNNIKDVVFDTRFGLQYSCTVTGGNYWKTPNQESIDAAIYVLENGSQFPEYVIFQSEFKQGNEVYVKIQNTYFCYWSKDVK